jgi:hypothetical protein
MRIVYIYLKWLQYLCHSVLYELLDNLRIIVCCFVFMVALLFSIICALDNVAFDWLLVVVLLVCYFANSGVRRPYSIV